MSTTIRHKTVLHSRRHVLKVAGALTVGTTFADITSAEPASVPARTQPSPTTAPATKAAFIQLGIFLSTFRGTLEARLDGVKAAGLDCVQLSMDCAGLTPMPDEISPELLARIRRESAARGIEIASLHGTFNMCHPDPEYRRGGVRRIGVLAAACEPLGTKKIHICTGTRDRISMWKFHPKNSTPEAWQDTVACIRDALDIAKPFGVALAFEPEVNNVVDSAKKARQLLDEINSPLLKVTMDGANLYHKGELPHMSEILDQSFALVGKDVVMAHAKDVTHDGDAGHEPAGHGKLDYVRYLSLLHAYGCKGPLFLHSLSEAQVPECVAYVREKMALAAAASKSG